MSERRLAARLREATRTLHGVAEGSGIMKELLRGRVDRQDYCAMLRNLHALYDALERALDRHAESSLVGPVRFPTLYRTAALTEDLQHLHGDGWPLLPLARSTEGYITRIRALSEEQPALLAAHAYVRYMGDLSGGQLLRNVVAQAFGLADGTGTAFYAFGDRKRSVALKERLRSAIDSLPLDDPGADQMVDEANAAFTLHIRLFDELASRQRPSV